VSDLTWRPAMQVGPGSRDGNHESSQTVGPHGGCPPSPVVLLSSLSLVGLPFWSDYPYPAQHLSRCPGVAAGAESDRAYGTAGNWARQPASYCRSLPPPRTVPSHGSCCRCRPPCIDAHPSIHPLLARSAWSLAAAACRWLYSSFHFFCALQLQVRAAGPGLWGAVRLASASPALSRYGLAWRCGRGCRCF
jgi:hypothetical protein